jgi:hypothetical protein
MFICLVHYILALHIFLETKFSTNKLERKKYDSKIHVNALGDFFPLQNFQNKLETCVIIFFLGYNEKYPSGLANVTL